MKHQLVAPHHGRPRRRGRDRGQGRGHSVGRGPAETPPENRPGGADDISASPPEREPAWWLLVVRAVYAPFARYVDRLQDEERAYRQRHDEWRRPS
jgi:hypothetical protein